MQTLQTSIDEAVEHRAVGDIGRYSRMADNFPRLWSNVEQVYQILRIETDDSLGTDAYRFQHIKSRTGSCVYTGGDRCDAIFIVYAGFLKTSWIDKYGNEKILDFPMKGDLIGFDGIESKTFKNTLVALSDIELIVVPLEFFSGTGGKAHGFRRRLMELMSQALISGQKVGYMMGTLPAEARVAKFLLSISQKFRGMGFSDKSFHLRMTREDIGSYLGLTLETVSRTLSGFARGGYIRVDQKYIEIVDPDGLKLLRRLPALKR
ncbi:MAG: Crp/Fnr family transcriptional regulator [Betaproteobacteria bacterium]